MCSDLPILCTGLQRLHIMAFTAGPGTNPPQLQRDGFKFGENQNYLWIFNSLGFSDPNP